MIINTISATDLKLSEGFNPEESCINLHKSKESNVYFWTCGNRIGPVTTQVPIEDVMNALPNVSFSDIVDEISGEIVTIMHITSKYNENLIVKL